MWDKNNSFLIQGKSRGIAHSKGKAKAKTGQRRWDGIGMPVGRVWHPFLSHKGSAPDPRKAPARLMCAVASEQRSPSTHIILTDRSP